MKHDLQEEIAQFVLEGDHIVSRAGICDFIGFLDRVRRNRLEILRDIPRATTLRVAQPRHDLHQGPYF